MNANTRTARAHLRNMTRTAKATRRAEKAITAPTASAKNHLIAVGLDIPTATRFAAAFSRGMVAQTTVTATIKLTGRRTKRVAVKHYNTATFAARLAVYRPKDTAAAARFEHLAA